MHHTYFYNTVPGNLHNGKGNVPEMSKIAA